MASGITPEERRALSNARIAERRNALNNYMKQENSSQKREEFVARKEAENGSYNALNNYIKSYKQESGNTPAIAENGAKNGAENTDVLDTAWKTAADVGANVVTGLSKGVEGVIDFGVDVIGAVGGLFSEDFKNQAKGFVQTDWTGDLFANSWQENLRGSLLDDNFLGQILETGLQGVGQMLPAVLVSAATGGTAALGFIPMSGAGLATLGASAVGTGTEEAFKEGADYYQGLGYGLASGAVEVGTELLTGKALSAAGKAIGGNSIGKIAKTGVKRTLGNMFEEGVEEGVSSAVNPMLKTIYKGTDALQEYNDPEYWKQMLVDFAGGAVAAGVSNATTGAIIGKYNQKKGGLSSVGKDADMTAISEANRDIDGELTKIDNNATIEDEQRRKLYTEAGKVELANLEKGSKILSEMNEKDRARIIKNLPEFVNVYNTDGTIKESAKLALTDYSQAKERAANMLLGEGDAEGKKNILINRSAVMNIDDLTREMKESGITAYTGTLTEAQQSKANMAVRIADRMGESFVLTNENVGNTDLKYNGAFVDFKKTGATIFIEPKQFDDGSWIKTVVHEGMHFIEGTDEYNQIVKLLENTGGETSAARIASMESVRRNGINLSQLNKDVREGNVTQLRALHYTERNAIMAENTIANEEFIARLCVEDEGLAKKVLNKIKSLYNAIIRTEKGIDDPAVKAEKKALKKAQDLYIKAIESAKTMRSYERAKRLTDDIDKNGGRVYNERQEALKQSRKDSLINHTFPTYKESAGSEANTIATRWAHRKDIEIGDQAAVSFNDNWYVIEKFDDSDLGYQIMERIAQKDYDKIEEEIKKNGASGRIRSIQRGSSDISQLDKRRDTARRVESSSHRVQVEHGGKNKQVQQNDKEQPSRGQIAHDRGGDRKSRRSSKQGLKFSLKESVEQDVIAKYGNLSKTEKKHFLNIAVM